MTLGVEDEGAVVVGVVFRPEAGLAVVLAAGLERGLVEGIDRPAVLGDEGDMAAGAGLRLAALGERQADPEFGLALDRTIAVAIAGDRPDHAVAQRLQRRVVEL